MCDIGDGHESSLSIRNISLAINGKVILKSLSFDAVAGDIIGFIGPNGAGKTTTMRLINGVISADSGDIEINNQNITKDPIKSREKLGYLPEGGPLWSEMTPKSYLEFMASVRGIKNPKEAIIAAVEKTELQEVFTNASKPCQKGSNAAWHFRGAILHDPEILILDEPTDGLDPNQKNPRA